jgi:hypothetical protein
MLLSTRYDPDMVDWFRKRWFSWFPPKRWVGRHGNFNIREDAKCAACLVLLEAAGSFFFFEDTHWHVCDRCYCSVPMQDVAARIWDRTGDYRLLKYFDHLVVRA